MSKRVVFSGIQPSGSIHIGNYLGAIKNWIDLQNKYQSIFCIVDQHALTVPQDPEVLNNKIYEIAAIYLACGIDPKKSVIFIQSSSPEHTELCWYLNCITHFGELKRMTQFKEKGGEKENVSTGLFDYPILMAADILLYQTDLVPVGDDQKQHVELARDIAKRFNQNYGETFTIPEALIQKQGARIMGLDDPAKKMSKSSFNPKNYIALRDNPETIRQKIMQAVTDSGSEIKYDPKNKPAISNLVEIYHLLSGETIKNLEEKYRGAGYGKFKKNLAEIVVEFIKPIQEKIDKLLDNKKELDNILERDAEQIAPVAQNTLRAVKKKMGLHIL